MRTSAILDALFTGPRQGILAATLLEPERWWYLSDLARHLGVHHATLQRELARLSESEILLTRRDGNRAYFRANTACPVFPDLRALLTKTSGLVGVLRGALAPLAAQIECAFVYGSVARAAETSESDVDLMIVGAIALKEFAPLLRAAENQIRRAVNPSLYRAEEFANKLASGNPFLARVLAREKIFIMGAEDDLERLVAGRKGRAARTRSSGN